MEYPQLRGSIGVAVGARVGTGVGLKPVLRGLRAAATAVGLVRVGAEGHVSVVGRGTIGLLPRERTLDRPRGRQY